MRSGLMHVREKVRSWCILELGLAVMMVMDSLDCLWDLMRSLNGGLMNLMMKNLNLRMMI